WSGSAAARWTPSNTTPVPAQVKPRAREAGWCGRSDQRGVASSPSTSAGSGIASTRRPQVGQRWSIGPLGLAGRRGTGPLPSVRFLTVPLQPRRVSAGWCVCIWLDQPKEVVMAVNPVGQTYRTGDTAPVSGIYESVGHTD